MWSRKYFYLFLSFLYLGYAKIYEYTTISQSLSISRLFSARSLILSSLTHRDHYGQKLVSKVLKKVRRDNFQGLAPAPIKFSGVICANCPSWFLKIIILEKYKFREAIKIYKNPKRLHPTPINMPNLYFSLIAYSNNYFS